MLPVSCLSIILYSILENGATVSIGLPSRTNRTGWSHSHVFTVCTFQRSAHDWSASFVCTLKGRRWSSQCLKRTLLLASMTNLFTTVVMLSVFMSISIVLIFFVIYFYFQLFFKIQKNLYAFFCFKETPFFSLPHQGMFQMTNVAGSQSEPSSHHSAIKTMASRLEK